MKIMNKKRFVTIAILAAICISFFGMRNLLFSKADEPGPASARLIYASNLDDDGNPTEDTVYKFDTDDGFGEGFTPYAVYVTQAEGPAMTLNSGTFGPVSVNYATIRIWNNNCEITVETQEGYVDRFCLIQTGGDSFLDVGWSHFNRGGCNAGVYEGEDIATAIATYFNAFVTLDENPENITYWNDESVTMAFDAEHTETNSEDPHYGKTVYTVTWEMEVKDLTLEENVILFLQDDVNDQEDVVSEGKLRVSGSITVGGGSRIEAVDEAPRLEILHNNLSLSGITLYDVEGESGETPLANNRIEGTYYFTSFDFSAGSAWIWTIYHGNGPVTIPEDAIGSPDVLAAQKRYIYAYDILDFNGDGRNDDDDLKYALAMELCYKFYGVYGMFGLPVEIIDNWGDVPPEEQWERFADAAQALSDRITFEDGGSIDVINDDGTTGTRQRFLATVNWGYTEEGELISDTVYVYRLDLPSELLICTDYDEEAGDGSTFYSRMGFDDKKVIVGDVDANFEEVDEDYFSTVIVTDTIGTVAVGGNAVSIYLRNADRNLFTFQTISYFKMKHFEENEWRILEPDLFVKIFKTGGKFFATASEGEAKRYDFVSNDFTGNAADKIWEAGGDCPVKLFIHDNVLHIMPLNANSGVAKALKEVRLTDSIPAAAVTIDNSNPLDIVITFNSNFYDTVNFELEYADGAKGAFTVEREGIIIQYTPLDVSGHGRYWLDIYGEGEGNEFNYTFDPETENFVVIASYYHSSAETGINNLKLIVTYDDGTTEVLDSVDSAHGFSGYKSGSSYLDDNDVAAVDTTSFIIGFMKTEGSSTTFTKNGHTGGFSVQVVKAGYNNADSFGGALAGSGKGKYWDGNADLYD